MSLSLFFAAVADAVTNHGGGPDVCLAVYMHREDVWKWRTDLERFGVRFDNSAGFIPPGDESVRNYLGHLCGVSVLKDDGIVKGHPVCKAYPVEYPPAPTVEQFITAGLDREAAERWAGFCKSSPRQRCTVAHGVLLHLIHEYEEQGAEAPYMMVIGKNACRSLFGDDKWYGRSAYAVVAVGECEDPDALRVYPQPHQCGKWPDLERAYRVA
jgi:hypothetical protein